MEKNEFIEKLNQSPLFRTIVGIVSLVVFGVLCGSFIFEITREGNLNWSYFYKAKSFYAILLSCFLVYLYYRFIFKDGEIKVNDFKDDDYCKAYMRREFLPELARKGRELIKSETDTKKIKKIIEDLNLK